MNIVRNDSIFFAGFPNNPNLDVSKGFGYKFFLCLPLSAKVMSIYRLTSRKELKEITVEWML